MNKQAQAKHLAAGPTLNPWYNRIYNIWAGIGWSEFPDCCRCHCNVTGKNLHRTKNEYAEWLCDDCFKQGAVTK